MKFNHVCLLIGVAMVILALTVFAHSSVINLDCSNTFDCSIKSYCQGISGAVPGLLVGGGSCYSYGSNNSAVNEPCDYSFTSQTTGTHSCLVTVTVSAMHSQGQTNENSTIYINGVNMGTTQDRYCNGGASEGCTFCGRDTQTLQRKVLHLEQNNTITIEGHDSHAVVAVVANCTPTNEVCVGGNCPPIDPCANDLAPLIEDVPDKSIKYYESFKIDLWNYIKDYDDSLADLNIVPTVVGNNITCTLSESRYLTCNGTNNLGTARIDISVKDSCNKSATESFNVAVYNSPPRINVPDMEKSCANDLNRFLDLRPLAFDENVLDLNYTIISESNMTLIDCNVVDKYFLSCKVNNCAENYSDLVIRVTDIFGVSYDDPFRITLKNFAPTWNTIPSQCINEAKTKFINLANYAYDVEDKNKLTYSITNQSNTNAVNCTIEDSNYISCTLSTNKNLSSVLTIKATDSNGKFATTTTTISTNCFDRNRITFEADNKGVCLEKCTTYGTQIKLANNTGERKCFNFDAESTPYNMLRVSVTPNEVCLNNGETTFITLNANTCGAEERAYQVKVFEIDSNLQMLFDFSVGNCNNFDGFRVTEFDGKICQGKEKSLTVFVKNISNSKKRVMLSADNAMVLPYFEKNYVDLEAGQEKSVQLFINARNLPLDYYNILLEGDADNYHISKRLEVEIVDCSEISKRTFSLSVPEVCYDVKRGQTLESQFSINRQNCDCAECYRNEKEFFFTLSGMPNELSYNSLMLLPSQGRTVGYTIFVPQNAPVGHTFLTLTGSDSQEWGAFTEQKLICLNVLGENKGGLVVNTQSKDIIWCGSEIFEIELSNTGDFDANYTLSATDIPTGVNVSFSETFVIVKKGETKKVYIAVSTNPSSVVKDNQWFKVNVKGTIEMSARIYFNIKEKTSFDDIGILSATKQVDMKGNSKATYDIVIRNNTESTMKNVWVSFENIPKDVNIESVLIAELASGKVVTLSGTITAGDTNGYFIPVFVVSSGQMVNKKPFGLYIEKNSFGQGINGLFMGLFSFGQFGDFSLGGVIGVLFLVLLLILLVTIIISGVAIITKPRKRKEVWLSNDN